MGDNSGSSRPLSILHVDAERGFSGGEVQVFLLMEGLRARGHRIGLACPKSSKAEQEALARGFKVHAVSMRNDLDLSSMLGLIRILNRSDYDLVHLHTGRATWLGGLAAGLNKVPAITTRRMDRRVKRGLRTRLIYTRLTKRVAAISPSVASSLLEGGVPEDRIRVIPSSVDRDRIRISSPHAGEELRGKLLGERSGDEVCVLVLAALVPRKGIDVLLSAMSHLGSEARPFLLIAGEGPSRATLEEMTRTLNLCEKVRFLGQRDDVGDLLAAADVMAMPSHREGLGIAALEAMAAGLPVLASEVGGLADAVEHEVTGLLLPPGNVEAWANGLGRLVGDRDLRVRLGTAGPRRVSSHFSPELMTQSYEGLYREVFSPPTSQSLSEPVQA